MAITKQEIRDAINYSKYEKDERIERLTTVDIIRCHQYIALNIPIPQRTRNKVSAIHHLIRSLGWEPYSARYNSEMALELERDGITVKIND